MSFDSAKQNFPITFSTTPQNYSSSSISSNTASDEEYQFELIQPNKKTQDILNLNSKNEFNKQEQNNTNQSNIKYKNKNLHTINQMHSVNKENLEEHLPNFGKHNTTASWQQSNNSLNSSTNEHLIDAEENDDKAAAIAAKSAAIANAECPFSAGFSNSSATRSSRSTSPTLITTNANNRNLDQFSICRPISGNHSCTCKEGVNGCDCAQTTASTKSYCRGNVNCSDNKYFKDDHDNNDVNVGDEDKILIKFASIMYATLLIILGCVLHVSELRQKSVASSSLDHIYCICVTLIGFAWLVHLQTDLQRYKRFAYKNLLLNRQTQRQAHSLSSLRLVSASSASSSSSSSLINGRLSVADTEIVLKKSAALQLYERQQQQQRNNQTSYKHNINNSDAHRKHALNDVSNSAHLHSIEQLNKRRNARIPAYKFVRGKLGANFYLKCGMAAFCFGHVIHDGLRFGQQLYFFVVADASSCQDLPALIAHLVTPLYSFYQLFILFKYSNLVINRHKTLARFGLMHIIGTSVTFWFRTIIEEAFEDFVHKMDYFNAHNKPNAPSMSNSTAHALSLLNGASSSSSSSSSSGNLHSATSSPLFCTQNTLLTAKSMNALPYLYPFTIEYNLLLAATFLGLYLNVGKICFTGDDEYDRQYCTKQKAKHKECNERQQQQQCESKQSKAIVDAPLSSINNHLTIQKPLSSSSSFFFNTHNNNNITANTNAIVDLNNGRTIALNNEEFKSNFVVNADCHSATMGLFGGFFVLLVTLVTIVIFFVTINKPTHVDLGVKINAIQEATLTCLLLIVMLVGFKQMSKLKRNNAKAHKVTTDDVLMLIPLPFFFVHTLLSFRAELATLNSIPLTQRGLPFELIKLPTRAQFQTTLISSGGGGALEDSRAGSLIVGQLFAIDSRALLFAEESTIQTSIASPSAVNQTTTTRQRLDQTTPKQRALNHNTVTVNSDKPVTVINKANITTLASRQKRQKSHNNNNNNNEPPTTSTTTAASKLPTTSKQYKIFTMCLNVLVMIEVLLQTCFIIDSSRRQSDSKLVKYEKPGRELITFAIILNITYWIVATFETKSVEQYKIEVSYYGPLAYMFISHTTLPVMLFYRYHSSVCLAEIWTRAYKQAKH